MTVTEFVIWFIFMAVATMTILVVGTLGAADLLHRPRRPNHEGDRSDDGHPEHQPDHTRARRDSPSEAGSGGNAYLVDALMPLGSSLSFVSRLNTPTAVDPSREHENPQHGPENPRHGQEDPQHGRAA